MGLDSDDAQPLRAELYRSFMQAPDDWMAGAAQGISLVVRSAEEPLSLADSIRRSTGRSGSEGVLYGVETMEQIISQSLAWREFSMYLLGAFAALALLLASAGLYGVISYLVGQRTHEVGLRIALGAQHGDVLRLVVGHGARMTLAGVGVGLAAALGLTRFMERYSVLFRVSATDPVTFAGVPILLMLVALAACYIPARRAMRVDPMVALRHESKARPLTSLSCRPPFVLASLPMSKNRWVTALSKWQSMSIVISRAGRRYPLDRPTGL